MLLTFAIGDIHGCLGKLRRLVARCEREAGGNRCKFVFIGDYIDRGPDSRGVIDYLMALQARLGGDAVFLMGNHEALALTVQDGGASAETSSADDGVLPCGGSIKHDFSPDQLNWLRALALMHDDGRRLFVHAGINPETPFDAQDPHDLVWIREPFLSATTGYGRLVVHGHTPMKTGWPDLRANRLNIDTGAVFGGPLTAALFTDERTRPVAYLQIEA